jgi:hypothetical protein
VPLTWWCALSKDCFPLHPEFRVTLHNTCEAIIPWPVPITVMIIGGLQVPIHKFYFPFVGSFYVHSRARSFQTML